MTQLELRIAGLNWFRIYTSSLYWGGISVGPIVGRKRIALTSVTIPNMVDIPPTIPNFSAFLEGRFNTSRYSTHLRKTAETSEIGTYASKIKRACHWEGIPTRK